MSPNLQAKLLKAIEEDEVQVRVRIVASTNIDLAQAMSDFKFRGDLYYRLNEIQVDLPPLRERGDDVIILANNPGTAANSSLIFPKKASPLTRSKNRPLTTR